MMRWGIRYSGVGALLLFAASDISASPAIDVGTMFDYLDSHRASIMKRIDNEGASTAFIKITVSEMVFDAQGNYHEEAYTGMTDVLAEKEGLLVSPLRQVIPPGGNQVVRYVWRGERNKERYFRIRFIPVVSWRKDPAGEASGGGVETGLKIANGFGTILVVRPGESVFDTKIEKTATGALLKNQGNSIVLLQDFKVCTSSGKLRCQPGTLIHLRPGETKRFEKQKSERFVFDLIEGDSHKPYQL